MAANRVQIELDEWLAFATLKAFVSAFIGRNPIATC